MINISARKSIGLKISSVSIFLLLAFFTGCTGVRIKDELPPSTPKGYVDFATYSLGSDFIYSIRNGQKVKEGSLRFDGDTLRLARTPGDYDFIIEHMDSGHRITSKRINVKVMQERLTFVTIDDYIIEVTPDIVGKYETSIINYKPYLSVAKNQAPLNFDTEPQKTDILMDLLRDPNWRARLYAVRFLQKSRNSRDENLLKRVGNLAINDPHKSVRTEAAALLKDMGRDAFENILLLDNFESNRRRWISLNAHYEHFYNDEFLFGSSEDKCENKILKTPLLLPGDFDLELTSAWRSGIKSGAYGILIGSDANNLDHFAISANGQAIVSSLRSDETPADLITWTDVSSIKKQGEGRNRLRVEVRGDKRKYYVNEAYVGEIANTMKIDNYTIGLRVCQAQKAAFEQLKISKVRKN